MSKNNIESSSQLEQPQAVPASDTIQAQKEVPRAESAAGSVKEAGQKRADKKVVPVDETAISPKHSIWPFALALSLIVVLLGMILHWIVLSLGILMFLGSIVGWILERR